MIASVNIRLKPQEAADREAIVRALAQAIGADVAVAQWRVRRRSIDARQRQVMVNLTIDYSDVFGELDSSAKQRVIDIPRLPAKAPQAIVVGFGPAGIFAALQLIREGIKPIVLERGKDVDSRRTDLAQLSRTGHVDPESNYCFGEGGAGAFSDGKLYTRSKKRGDVDSILQLLYQHGAPEEILVEAHPHIGTDLLPKVIKSLRQTIEKAGGEVLFNKRVDGLIIRGNKCVGVQCADGTALQGPVILATGHSARDVYRWLADAQVALEPKGIAVGVRLEHPQEEIDKIMYHSSAGRGQWLPAAEYTMLTRVDGRAVYSFCMCPGGYVIPAANHDGQLVVNGMSPANRGTRWANSGMVVEVLPQDIKGDDALKMMRYQEDIERAFAADTQRYLASPSHDDDANAQNAPAQLMTDFVSARGSEKLPRCSYTAGVHPARVDLLLPKPISRRLQRGFSEFGKKYKGFLTPRAVVIGAETRTSSPVRIPRDPDTLQHIAISGLYPVGEGAGYAGGIVSAAIDGVRAAQALASKQ